MCENIPLGTEAYIQYVVQYTLLDRISVTHTLYVICI